MEGYGRYAYRPSSLCDHLFVHRWRVMGDIRIAHPPCVISSSYKISSLERISSLQKISSVFYSMSTQHFYVGFANSAPASSKGNLRSLAAKSTTLALFGCLSNPSVPPSPLWKSFWESPWWCATSKARIGAFVIFRFFRWCHPSGIYGITPFGRTVQNLCNKIRRNDI